VYLHLGEEKVISNQEIVGIFDYDLVKKSKTTKEYLELMDNDQVLEKVSKGKIVKSFIVTNNKVFLSPISSLTLQKRMFNQLSQK